MSAKIWPVSPDVEEYGPAVKWFLSRVPMSKDRWLKFSQAQRRKAFTVAGIARADVLHDVFKALDRAVAKGTTLDTFKKEVGAKLRREWAGSVKNPAFRMEVIFRDNVQLAYSAGRWAQMTDPGLMKVRPFGMLDVILDNRVSDICESLAGTVLPWAEFAKRKLVPPLHHMCRTILRSLRRKQAERQSKFGKPVPKVSAQEGWGLPPDKSEWEPDLKKYPPALRKHVQQRLSGAKDVGPMSAPDAVKFVPEHKAPKDQAKYGAFEEGVHAKLLKSGVDRRETATVLKGAEKADLIDFLVRRPLEELTIGDLPARYSTSNGLYYAGLQNLWVRAPREEDTFGIKFVAGKSWSISKCAKTANLAQQRTFVHELGHHLGFTLMKGAAGRRVIEAAWSNPRRKPITEYAWRDEHEYVAECFAAYVYHRARLKTFDPVGFAMVEELVRMGGEV